MRDKSIRYIGFKNKGNRSRNSGDCNRTLPSAKASASMYSKESDEVLVREFKLVPTGKFFVKQDGEWTEHEDEYGDLGDL